MVLHCGLRAWDGFLAKVLKLTESFHVSAGETLCKNGGECNPDPTETDSFVCDCLDGFSGTTCEESK